MKRLLILLTFCLILPMSYAETVIDHVPYSITSSGTYVLNSDLSGGRICIDSDNVVLDGQGHKLTNGCIVAQGKNNVTIKNIGVFDSNSKGIILQGCENITLSQITANDNKYYGIFLQACKHCQLSDITTDNNGNYGIYLQGSNYNTFNGLTTSGNGIYGVYLPGSDYNTFNGLTTSGNGIYGVELFGSKNNTFYNWQIPEGWNNCGNINNSGYNGNIFYNSPSGNSTEGNESSSEVSSGNTIKTPIPLPAIIIILSIPIIALRKLN